MGDKKQFGKMAEFDSPKSLMKAAEKFRDEGFKKFDVFSPFPIHGMDDAMGLSQSKLGILVLACGILGGLIGMGLQGWAATEGYALKISGKELFSFQAFIPVTFELTILFSAFGAVFGMFALNKFPRWHRPEFNVDALGKSTNDGFFLMVESSDQKYDANKVEEIFKELDVQSTHEIEEES